jgi:hypothetical protein
MDAPDISPAILNDITQIITAVGVILTALSSILNRRKLEKVGDQVDAAVAAAEAAKVQAKRSAIISSAKIEEVKQAAIAVNAEVVQEVHSAGVEAGKEIAANGKG